MGMIKLVTILILTAYIRQAYADDDFEKLYLLSEDMRDVVLKSPGGHPMPNRDFFLTPEQSDQMKALANLDDSMNSHLSVNKEKRECDQLVNENLQKSDLEKRIDNRDFQLEVVLFSNNKKFEQNALGRFTTDDYLNYMGQLYIAGNTKAYNLYNIQMLEDSYKQAHPEENLNALTLSQKEKILNEYAESYLSTKLPSGLLMKEMAYQKMVAQSAEWKAVLAEAKDKLTSEQKIQLVSKLGGLFGNQYNYARRDKGDNARGEFVDTQQLLESIKNGTLGGICRDIALAQTQMLKELGFTNNYVLLYKTLSGRHVTVISTDPVTGKVVKFNYGETTEMQKGSGTEALTQATSMPDHGLAYNIYDTNGKPVTKVSSELGQMLKESAGGDNERDFNQRNFSLTKVGFSSPYIDGNIFTGNTSLGENIYGVALYKKMVPNEYISLGAGASFSRIEGNKSLVHIEQDNLYLQANLELSSPKLRIGGYEGKAFAGGSADLLIYNSNDTNFSGGKTTATSQDASADFYAGVKNSYKTSDEKTKIDSTIYANFYPDWNHVARGDKIVAALDNVVIKTGVSHAINDDTRALIDTAVVLRNYGTNIVVKGILEDDKNGMRYSSGASMPVSSNMPTFLNGGERRAFASIEKETKNVSFTIEYERNFDNQSNSISAKAKVKF